jgi:selenocysteine lyase/cysteine desulfurase
MLRRELIDVAAAAGHKWLLTPEGIGLLYSIRPGPRSESNRLSSAGVSVPNPDRLHNFGLGMESRERLPGKAELVLLRFSTASRRAFNC